MARGERWLKFIGTRGVGVSVRNRATAGARSNIPEIEHYGIWISILSTICLEPASRLSGVVGE
jgi:hypothetical protein